MARGQIRWMMMLIAGAASATLGQVQPSGSSAAGNSAAAASADQPPMIPADLTGGSGSTALQPVTFQLAPSVDGDYIPPATLPTNLFRENVFLTRRAGKVYHDTDGSLLFQPDPIGQLMPDQTLPPLKLLPCRQLTALEPLLSQAVDARVTLTGWVTTYCEQNYLLVTIATAGAETTQPTDDATLASGKTLPPTTRPNPATMAAGDLLDQMLAPSANASRPLSAGAIQQVDQTSGENAVAPNAKPQPLMREGLFVVDRVGRLQKTATSNEYQFVFDNDGKSLGSPPMIVLPNQKLATMEQSLRSTSRDVLFRVTGQVTEYNGRNYLLMEKVVIPPAAAEQF